MKNFKFSHFIRDILRNADIYVGGIIFGAMVVLTFVNVVMRYVFKIPIIWSEEVILITFTWSTFLGIIACFRYDAHMRIEFFYDLMSKPLQKFVDIGSDIVFLGVFGYLTYLSYMFCSQVGLKRTLVLKISSNIFNIAMLVCFGIMTISSIFKIYHKLKGDYKVEDPLADVKAEDEKME